MRRGLENTSSPSSPPRSPSGGYAAAVRGSSSQQTGRSFTDGEVGTGSSNRKEEEGARERERETGKEMVRQSSAPASAGGGGGASGGGGATGEVCLKRGRRGEGRKG